MVAWVSKEALKQAIETGWATYYSRSRQKLWHKGEESGNVDDLLTEVADFYDSEVEYDLKRLSAAIEPILIVFIAGMVLVLALGVFLPIWDLANAAQ